MKRLKPKKVLKWSSLLLVVLCILIILPALSYRQKVNLNPLPSRYKKGVYHMHSVFSDGKGDLEEITLAAAAAGADFAILTDHGEPNRLAALATAWMNDVLLIGGSELSLDAGHLAAAGFRLPDRPYPPEAQEAIDEIIGDGGVCFISHPFDTRIPWTDWGVHGFTGLEVFNCYSSARKASPVTLAVFPLQYLFNPRYALLNILNYPAENLSRWDRFNEKGRYFAIYASDAHAVLPVSDAIRFYFPSYVNMFRLFQVYVQTDHALGKDPRQSAAMIITALRHGRFFNAVEAIAPANGFDAVFHSAGGDVHEMGGVSPARSGSIRLELPFEFSTDVHLLRNGTVQRKITGNRHKQLMLEIDDAGVYRIEVFLGDHTFPDIPWILTNPFFIGREPVRPGPPIPPPESARTPLPIGSLTVEANPATRADLERTAADDGRPVLHFTFRLAADEGRQDFWAALARRQRVDLSRQSGFCFEARGVKRQRFWLEFRVATPEGEGWYRHSFAVAPEWRVYALPFARFRRFHGADTAAPPDMGRVRAVFFAINNVVAYAGAHGALSLREIGTY